MTSGLDLNLLAGIFCTSEVLTNLGKNNLNNFMLVMLSCRHLLRRCPTSKKGASSRAGLRQDEVPKKKFPIFTLNPHPPPRQADEVGAKEEEEDNTGSILTVRHAFIIHSTIPCGAAATLVTILHSSTELSIFNSPDFRG